MPHLFLRGNLRAGTARPAHLRLQANRRARNSSEYPIPLISRQHLAIGRRLAEPPDEPGVEIENNDASSTDRPDTGDKPIAGTTCCRAGDQQKLGSQHGISDCKASSRHEERIGGKLRNLCHGPRFNKSICRRDAGKCLLAVSSSLSSYPRESPMNAFPKSRVLVPCAAFLLAWAASLAGATPVRDAKPNVLIIILED